MMTNPQGEDTMSTAPKWAVPLVAFRSVTAISRSCRRIGGQLDRGAT
jgi:hypothetical protein